MRLCMLDTPTAKNANRSTADIDDIEAILGVQKTRPRFFRRTVWGTLLVLVVIGVVYLLWPFNSRPAITYV
jgi:hypothetical protein